MLIDWFTVVAQLINFLILVYLLKRFLYRPILDAMDRREEQIANRLKDADQKRDDAQRQKDEYRRKAREVEEERSLKIKAAEQEAQKRRRELLDRAKEEAEALRENWRASLAREQRNFMTDLKQRASSEVVRIAEKALSDLADAELETSLVAKFSERIASMSRGNREKWVEAVSEGEILVKSSFDMETSLQQQIAEALKKIGDREPDLSFRRESGMSLGLEMIAEGVSLSWGLESYFDSLENRVRDLLKEQAESSGRSGKKENDSENEKDKNSGETKSQDPGDKTEQKHQGPEDA